jgi:CRP/FNR family cyclic AMP-dependent transcriptional regulator
MATLDVLRHAHDCVHFSAGSTVLDEGRPGKLMYVVKEGAADIFVHGRLVATVGPGEVVGELALIDDRARSAAVVARTDCQLVPVDEKRFLFLVQQTPYFALQVMRVLAERLRKMNEIVGG